jgi:hypothetical protein
MSVTLPPYFMLAPNVSLAVGVSYGFAEKLVLNPLVLNLLWHMNIHSLHHASKPRLLLLIAESNLLLEVSRAHLSGHQST